MENHKKAACPENEPLAAFLLNKRQELAQSPKGISDNMDMTLSKAYSNICNCKSPIKTLKDLSQIKGVGKWILKQMQGLFQTDSGSSDNDDVAKKGNKNKGPKRYVPQKNSVAFALLITLFRGTESGNEFMLKTDLIDAAETSGLSRVPIIPPEKAKGKAGHFGSSPRDWYTGWSCMKTLINRGLVVKSSCPAKYMLTDEGKEVARECLLRSGMIDSNKTLNGSDSGPNLNKKDKMGVDIQGDVLDLTCNSSALAEKQAPHKSKKQKISIDMQPEYLDKFISMGFSRQQITRAYSEAIETSKNKEISSIWPTVLCRLREEEIFGSTSVSKSITDDHYDAPSSIQPTQGLYASKNIQPRETAASCNKKSLHDRNFEQSSFTMKACSSTDFALNKCGTQGSESRSHTLAMPPLAFGEKFGDVYEVILILDNREHFATQGSRSKKIIENISSQFCIQIEVRRLPVGDGIWIARHKLLCSEYVLDFIVERKNVNDLRHSIRDNRYRDQKMRLVRCGLKKMIYLVEGDPNSSEAAESIKTACFTTEILEGFDVQRTTGLADTLRKYGYLTQSINQFYKSLDHEEKQASFCPPFDEFIRRCEELDKLTISDVFAIQLMQVPQVTEDIALAVLDMYPTVLSLARAYSHLDGDVCGQEEMLKKQSNNFISGAASKNIFQLVWGG